MHRKKIITWLTLIILVLSLGVVGAFYDAQNAGLEFIFSHAILKSFAQFLGDFGDLEKQRSAQALASCYLAVLLTATGVISGIVSLFKDRFDRAKIKSWSGHTVVVGLNSLGLECVKNAINNDELVVGVDIDEDAVENASSLFSSSRAIFVTADASDPMGLEELGNIVSAEKFVVVAPNNLEILDSWLEVHEQNQKITSVARKAYFNMTHSVSIEALRQACDYSVKLKSIDVQAFCPSMNLVLKALRTHPIDSLPDAHRVGRITEIGIYATKDNVEIALNAIALISHFASNAKLSVTLYGADLSAIEKRSPLFEIINLVEPSDTRDCSYDNFYIVADSSYDIVKAKTILRDVSRTTKVIPICTSSISRGILGDIADYSVQPIFEPPWEHGKEIDGLAIQIHDFYRSKYGDLAPWSELEQWAKDTNRNAARHIPVKLRALGFEICTDNEGEGLPILNKAQLDELSPMEHVRWCAEKKLAGYKFGAKKNSLRRTHPDLIPFADLNEDAKDKDKLMISKLPEMLENVGLKVFPIK